MADGGARRGKACRRSRVGPTGSASASSLHPASCGDSLQSAHPAVPSQGASPTTTGMNLMTGQGGVGGETGSVQETPESQSPGKQHHQRGDRFSHPWPEEVGEDS